MTSISEIFLDSRFLYDHRLKLTRYNSVTTDNPDNNKIAGVCVYFKEFLFPEVFIEN